MKKLHIIAGVLVIGLLAQSGLTKSKSRNGRTHRQAYLPPRAGPKRPAITEEYITIHEQAPSGQSPFKESSYSDGRYQIFEIHNHFEPYSETGKTHSNFNARGYLPPQQKIRVEHVNKPQGGVTQHVAAIPPVQEEIIHVEHIHVQGSGQQTGVRTSEPHAGSSVVFNPPHQKQHNAQQQYSSNQKQFTAPEYLPPHEPDIHSHPVAIQKVSSQQQVNGFAHIQQGSLFKGPDYFPPHSAQPVSYQNIQFPVEQSNQFKGQDYLPPYHENHYETRHYQVEQQKDITQQISHENQFKGPDYLPPHLAQYNHQHGVKDQVVNQPSAYKGLNYLRPNDKHQNHHNVAHHVLHQTIGFQQQNHHQNVQQQLQTTYKGSNYLPPFQQQLTQHQVQQHLTSFQRQNHNQEAQQQQTAYKGPDYLPPHQEQQIQHQNTHQAQQHLASFQENHHNKTQQHVQQQSYFKGPDYLPPHEEHESIPYKGPDYLPPHLTQPHHTEQLQQQFSPDSKSNKGPDYLPPYQEQQVPQQEVQFDHPQHYVQHQVQSQPGSLPAGYEPQIPVAPVSQSVVKPPSLPQGYDFEKPANAEQAIVELHSLPQEHKVQQEVVVQSQTQGAQGPQHANVVFGNNQSGVNYQTNGYLLPHQSTPNYQSQPTVGPQQRQTPKTFKTTPVAPDAQPPTSNYLPQAIPVQAHRYSTNLHSLSSYMTNIQPFERYGSALRQPFLKYGPPPTAFNNAAIAQQEPQQHQQQSQPLPVTPMYREHASSSQYAPAMTYATNGTAKSYAIYHTAIQHKHHSFDHQTKQNLQQLMPSDIRPPSSAAAVPDRQPASNKIRTVQILNSAAVKTLKVLETSDHAGVKTIKIIGPSNTEPTGDHRVVKVVSQNASNAPERVQTVNIFNDHEEVGPGQAAAGGNAYLLPSQRVVRETPLKLQLLPNEKYRRPFNERFRYRY